MIMVQIMFSGAAVLSSGSALVSVGEVAVR